MLLSASAQATTIAYWRFEEGQNGVQHDGDQDDWYKDSSGFTNDMSSWWEPSRPTPTNSLPFSTVPQSGAPNTLAMDFVPNEDLGTFGALSPYMVNNYPFTNGFTVECMVKVRQLAWQVPVGKDGEPSSIGWWDPSFHIKFRNDSPTDHKIHLGFWSTPSNWVSCMSTFDYNIGEWYYIAAVCDGTQAYLYVKEESDTNYELESTVEVPGGKGMLMNNEQTWTIGRGMWHGGAADWVDGIIDEVRISDTALPVNQFLAYGAAIITGAPEFVQVNWSGAPTPVETRDVTVSALIKASNTIVTNADLFYRVNSGSYLGPINMMTNNSTDDFTCDIPKQAVDSVVDFYMIAANAIGQITTSMVYQYQVYEDIQWKTVSVTANASAGFPNMTSMAISPDGTAGFVYRSASTSNAMYVQEISLGVLGSVTNLSNDPEGFISDLTFGSDNEPRAVLSYDTDGGVTYVQRSNGVWNAPMMIVTNIFSERRAVIAIAPDDKSSVLWYENGNGANGKLITVSAAGDSFSASDVFSPPFSTTPNDLRRPFEMKIGTDGKRRIVISGPGSGDDQIWFGTEDSVGAGSFSWEQVAASNLYADQIGFTLDDNDYAYIACKDFSWGHPNARCALLENSSGSWVKHNLSDIPDWNRSAVAIDNDGNIWVAHNAYAYNHLYLWSNRSGSWKEEQTITNGFAIETISGFGFSDNNTMKIAYTPTVDSPELVYMYSTKFAIPEPGIIIGGFIFLLLFIKRK